MCVGLFSLSCIKTPHFSSQILDFCYFYPVRLYAKRFFRLSVWKRFEFNKFYFHIFADILLCKWVSSVSDFRVQSLPFILFFFLRAPSFFLIRIGISPQQSHGNAFVYICILTSLLWKTHWLWMGIDCFLWQREHINQHKPLKILVMKMDAATLFSVVIVHFLLEHQLMVNLIRKQHQTKSAHERDQMQQKKNALKFCFFKAKLYD